MKIFFATLILLACATSFAHVEPGLYQGVSDQGVPCAMTAGATTFEKNQPHPLNERIALQVGSDAFSVAHPALIDLKVATVSFDHGLLQAVLPTPVGAKALSVTMVHSPSFEGPSDYLLIESDWKAKTSRVLRCLQLRHANAFRR